MKPVVSAAQIAVQAYAQRTPAPSRVVSQPGFSVDTKSGSAKGLPEKGFGPTARVSQETDAFKIEISAEALEAASRDGGRRSAQFTHQSETADAADISFRLVERAQGALTANRREAPFAHDTARKTSDEPPRRPGFLLDITI